jgi:ABC-type transport system involved in multi-copper enzyme maturation permease subunit
VTLYWLVDLNTADVRFLYFLLNLFLAELFGASFLIAVSSMTSSSLYAGVIVPSVLMLFILTSGVFIFQLFENKSKRLTKSIRFHYSWKSNTRLVDLVVLGLASSMGVRGTFD